MAGLPGQTWPGLLEDVKALMRAGVAEIQLERLKLLPGTPLAETPGRWGLSGTVRPPYQVLETDDFPAADLRKADLLARVLDWYYNKPALRDILAEGAGECDEFLSGFIARFAAELERGPCPDLETRLRWLEAFWVDRSARMVQRVRYRWARSGLSLRNGPAPAKPWKGRIPGEAVLVEGDRNAAVSRIWRVELDEPHYFCFGKGDKGERVVVAVFREGARKEDERRKGLAT
jgi:hypothetical protein